MQVKNFLHQQPSDSILINQLEVSCRIGHTKNERAFPHVIEITAELFLSLLKSGKSDRMKDTLDYVWAIELIRKVARNGRHALLEGLSEKIASALLSNKKISAVRIVLTKKIFEGIDRVGVQIYRENQPSGKK